MKFSFATPFSMGLVCASFGLALHADTVTLRPVADTTLWELNAGNNLGSSTLVVGTTAGIGASPGRSRAVMRFDLSSIPANAVVTSAKLAIRVTKVPPGAVSSLHTVHKLLVSWAEGNKGGSTGAVAGPGEATWSSRGTGGNWSTPGAQSPGDHSAVVSASKLIGGLGAYTFDSTPALVADVQDWVKNPASNFGWILRSGADATPRSAKRLSSRENGASGPSLVIEYTAGTVVAPPTIATQPVSARIYPGIPVQFSVGAGGAAPLTYQWLKDGKALAGAAATTLVIPAAAVSDAGSYSVAVSNAGGNLTSNPATLAILPLPSIDNPRIEGDSVVFNFSAAAGHIFQVEKSDALPAVWTPLTNIIAGADIPSALVRDSSAGGGRYYRLSIQPAVPVKLTP